MKTLKNKKAPIAFGLLSVLFIGGVVGLGFFYAKNGSIYDVTSIGPAIGSMNYITGSGDVNRLTTPIVEGLVTTSVDFNDSTPGDDGYERSNAYAIGELEAKGGEAEVFANQIQDLYSPLTYTQYDGSTIGTGTSSEYTPPGSKYYALGATDEIVTNNDFTSFRFYIRDDSRWSNGDYVRAEDFVFAINKQMPLANGTASSYMLYDYSGIKGMSEAKENQNEDVDTSKDSITYGLSKSMRDLEIKVDSEEEANSDTSHGIIYYDAQDHGTVGADRSFVQFNLVAGNDTFPTMTNSAAYLPVNFTWWNEVIGYDSMLWEFGFSEDKILANGAYRVTRFDNSYGMTVEKNPYYHDVDAMSIENGQYRMVTEASTQISLFQNNYASYVQGTDANSKILADNEEVSSYIKPSFTPPTSRYLFFNLHKDNKTDSAIFTKDPNFRRAIYYSVDRTKYHTLAGYDRTLATSIFTPSRMYSDSDGDFVDFATQVGYSNNASVDSGSTDPIPLETWTLKDREEVLKNGIDPAKDYDPNTNVDYANYYWEVFLNDMNQLGVDVPQTIDLIYLTSNGDKDPILKTLQENLNDPDLVFASRINIIPKTQTSSAFWNSYYAADGYDLASIKWNPDFVDPWAMLSVFNLSQPSRKSNSTAEWNYWDGSDYSFSNDLYDDPELARKLFDDGVSSMYDETTNLDNIFVEPELLSKLEIATVADATAKINELVGYVVLDNTGTTPANLSDWFKNSRVPLSDGLDKDAHYEFFNDQSNKIFSYLLLEILLKDSAAVITMHNETSSSSPTRIIFGGDPLIGYYTMSVAFDFERISKNPYWKDIFY